ncbi:uncharacterized protein F4812DRAFT_305019 [Daldinia caldariorum]|uniref:uncharacterized protein n=1 Tax=Daldinia caldariorum TaxID=326644 RepID=UPI0020079857|nr:uncharacterized protein F4812DRAFT_305019 [Daldinia caldariorum]KAI1469856.1 hypothetical protein F4812DRAFT_305019 [Daldinia caldariorum]
MSSRSRNHHSRHDDPYVFDDPYRHSTSPINSTGYEYVGTEEVSNASRSHRGRSPIPQPRRRHSPKGHSRTTSPPPHSRHDRDYTTPPKSDRRPSPPRASRHTSPPRSSGKASRSNHHEDQKPPQRPGVERTKSLGQKSLKFLSEAAALYAATQGGPGGRDRSQSHDRSRRSSHYDSESRHCHHHRHHSPSRSPSPHRRRSRAYSDDPPRRHRRHRSPSVSDESDYEPDRGRRHRRSRARSYTPSLSPSPPRHRGRKSKSVSSSFRSSKVPDEAASDRWQMAARAALEAAGLTAFRLRKEPGSWTGDKGAKVATAALGAAAIDAFIDKDPRQTKSKGVKGFAENTISSMIASKIMGVKSPNKRRARSRF